MGEFLFFSVFFPPLFFFFLFCFFLLFFFVLFLGFGVSEAWVPSFGSVWLNLDAFWVSLENNWMGSGVQPGAVRVEAIRGSPGRVDGVP